MNDPSMLASVTDAQFGLARSETLTTAPGRRALDCLQITTTYYIFISIIFHIDIYEEQ